MELAVGGKHPPDGAARRFWDRFPLTVALFTRDARLVYVNRAGERLTGYPRARLMGRGWRRCLFPAGCRPELRRLLGELASDDAGGREFRVWRSGGEPLYLELFTVTERKPRTLLLIGVDVTARKRREDELEIRVRARADALQQSEALLGLERVAHERAEAALRITQERFRSAVESYPGTFIIYDGQRRMRYVNARTLALLGVTSEQMIGRTDEELFPPELTRQYLPALERALRTRTEQSVECTFASPRGDHTLVVTYVPLLDASGAVVQLIATSYDITERLRAEEGLRLAAKVFESTAEAIMIMNAQRRIVRVNEAFTRMTGYAPEEVLGRTPAVLDSGLHEAEFFRAMWESVAVTGQWQGEIWNRRKSGDIFPELLDVGAVRNEKGEVVNYVALFRDITEIKQTQRQLEYLANYDPLTALPNRNLFHDRLRHGLEKAARSGKRLAVLFIDLDNFKAINDTRGHDVGDLILKEAAARLLESVRDEDTVARLGGDEFVVLLEDVQDVVGVAEMAQRVNENLFLTVAFEAQSEEISGSIGIGVYPEDGRDAQTLLKRADTAMYQAKALGGNTYQFFAGGVNHRARARLALERDLRLALARNEFFLGYQPQIDLREMRVSGVEAVLRWRHPEMGMLRPRQFLPVAEASGLIEPIGAWVLEMVCRQLAAWSRAGHPPPRVAVNLSAREFRGADLIQHIAAAIAGAGIDAGSLEVELGEALLMHDTSAPVALQLLREAGVHIAVDDVGTAYSSLRHLRRLPVERLKIDRSVVSGAAENSAGGTVCAAFIDIAHRLGMRALAQGVETEAELAFLRASGCDEAQGFYFSPPIAADELERYRL